MTLEELHHTDVIQARTGANLGRADDLAFSPETGRIEGLILHGRPRLFGLLGRQEDITLPWGDLAQWGEDVILVNTEVAIPERPGLLRRLLER